MRRPFTPRRTSSQTINNAQAAQAAPMFSQTIHKQRTGSAQHSCSQWTGYCRARREPNDGTVALDLAQLFFCSRAQPPIPCNRQCCCIFRLVRITPLVRPAAGQQTRMIFVSAAICTVGGSSAYYAPTAGTSALTASTVKAHQATHAAQLPRR